MLTMQHNDVNVAHLGINCGLKDYMIIMMLSLICCGVAIVILIVSLIVLLKRKDF